MVTSSGAAREPHKILVGINVHVVPLRVARWHIRQHPLFSRALLAPSCCGADTWAVAQPITSEKDRPVRIILPIY